MKRLASFVICLLCALIMVVTLFLSWQWGNRKNVQWLSQLDEIEGLENQLAQIPSGYVNGFGESDTIYTSSKRVSLDTVSSELQTSMQTYITAVDNTNFLSVWYPVDGAYTWSFAPTFIFSGSSQKVIWTLSDGTNMLAWVQGYYDVSTNRFSNLVLNYSQYGNPNGRELKGSSVEAWY